MNKLSVAGKVGQGVREATPEQVGSALKWVIIGGAVLIAWPLIQKRIESISVLNSASVQGTTPETPNTIPNDAQVIDYFYSDKTLSKYVNYWYTLPQYHVNIVHSTRKGSFWRTDPIAMAWWAVSQSDQVYVEYISYV